MNFHLVAELDHICTPSWLGSWSVKLIIKLTNIWFKPQLGHRSVKTNPILFCLVTICPIHSVVTILRLNLVLNSSQVLFTLTSRTNPRCVPSPHLRWGGVGDGRGESLPPSQLSQLVVSFGWLTPKCLMHLLARMQRYPNTCKIIRYLPDSCCLLSLGYAALITSCLYRCVRLKYWIKVVFSWTTKIL